MNMQSRTSSLFAIIMAGGKGERFWPAGRAMRPKQLLSLTSEKTMIEETVQRLFPLIPPEQVLVITNRDYVEQIRDLLPIPSENVIGEPERRDTAPCVALATALVRRKDPDATMIILPADHVIRPAKVFQDTLKRAADQAQNGYLITLGIPPSFPSTGYGYLHLGADTGTGFYPVLEFKEKPDQATAEAFLKDGNYRWNSGIFVWRADTISEAFRRYAPDLGKKLDAWAKGADFIQDFASCRKISIDYAVMEKAENIIAVDAPFEWNDIGSWSSLRSFLPLDQNGNASLGCAVAMDSSDNVFFSDDGTLIAAIGLHRTAVIKSGNALLVCPLADEQKIKKILEKTKDSFK